MSTSKGVVPPWARSTRSSGAVRSSTERSVSKNPVMLTEWAVGFLTLFDERPRPRVGLHLGSAVYREGDYFGGDVNLAHRVVEHRHVDHAGAGLAQDSGAGS